jgi:hypothetical protein
LFHLGTEIEKHYAKCGWNARFFKESAVSNREGFTSFFTDDDQYNLEWGAGLVGGKNKRLVSSELVPSVPFVGDEKDLI